jgi:hypothetical protein
MNIRKHAFSITYGTILTLVAGGFLFLLIKTRGNFVEVKDRLQKAETDYQTLSEANPYPSSDNVKVMQTNLQMAVDFYVELQSELCRDRKPPELLGAAQFNVLLQDTFTALREAANWQGGSEEEAGTLLPEPFYFGFDQYTGALPEEENIPRLVRQLRTIESVCTLLFENRVSAIEKIDRTIFEAGVQGGQIQGRGLDPFGNLTPLDTTTAASAEEESDLYSVEHVNIIFHARDEQLWKVMDAFCANPVFTVVTDVALVNTAAPDPRSGSRTGRRPMMPPTMMNRPRGGQLDQLGLPPNMRNRGPMLPGEGRRSSNEPVILLAREDRIAAGQDERVQATLGLDVYRFCPEAEEEEALDPLAAETEEGEAL